MKALSIPTITLLLSLFIAGIQSQAEPKLPVAVYQNHFPSALTQLKTTLSQEMEEINEIKESVGRSSSKAENMLTKCVKIISYLDELLEVSPADTLKCLIPGAKPDPVRGVCYLLVTNPMLTWAAAEQYCDDLKGDLLTPLILDTTLGDTLTSLFPELTTLTGNLWVDGEIITSGTTFVYENGFDTGISSTGGHLTMTLPLTTTPGTPPTIAEDATTDVTHPFICQFDALTVLPPFKMAEVDDYGTYIPDRNYMVDVESFNDVYHHSGENSDGYGHPNEEYQEEGYPMDGYPMDGYPMDGYPMEGYPREGSPGEGSPGEGPPEGDGNPEGPYKNLARQLNPKIIL